MMSSSPIFVRCLKPNHVKVPGKFDENYIQDQVCVAVKLSYCWIIPIGLSRCSLVQGQGSTFKFGKLASFLRILETSLYIDTLLSYFGVLVLCYLNFCFFQSIKTCVASLSIIYYPCILAFELQLFSFQHSKVINICKTSDPIHILVVILIKFYNTYVCQ